MIDALKEYEIVIPLPSESYLVATSNRYPFHNTDIFIGLVDKNGRWFQDLACVRNAYDIDPLSIFNPFPMKCKKMEVLVCTHGWDDEYSQKFLIDEIEEEE